MHKTSFFYIIATKLEIILLLKTKRKFKLNMSCYCSHSSHKLSGHSCCSTEDYNLTKLKSTNEELKSLIRKIDQLSDSFMETKKCHSRHDSFSCCNCASLTYQCNVCRDKRLCKAKSKYEYVLCEDCENMLRVANEIERKPIKIDQNVYPIEKYPRDSRSFCKDCEECKRESRERSRSRSRSRHRSTHSRSVSPSSRRNSMTELRPIWNGGKS